MREPTKRPRARASARRKPRRWTGLVMTLAVLVAMAAGLGYARSVVTGDSGDGVHIPGTDLVLGAHSTDSSKANADGIPESWPPVPADASPTPLGAPPAKESSSREFGFIETVTGIDGIRRPVAWDPCRPIHLVVNDARAPAHADKLLHAAVAQVSRATGLQFVFDGPTSEAPAEDRAAQDKHRYGDRWSPVLIAWTDPGTVPQLKGTVAGLAGPEGAPYIDAEQQHWVSGSVNLDGPQLTTTLQRPTGWIVARAIVMHELGHLVGLKHVPESTELMYADTTGRKTFGPGDREGLRRLGLGPCFNN